MRLTEFESWMLQRLLISALCSCVNFSILLSGEAHGCIVARGSNLALRELLHRVVPLEHRPWESIVINCQHLVVLFAELTRWLIKVVHRLELLAVGILIVVLIGLKLGRLSGLVKVVVLRKLVDYLLRRDRLSL